MKRHDGFNASCIICGKRYYSCSCPGEEPWKWCTDTINCYKIYQVLRDYNNKVITKEEAKKGLSDTDLSGYKAFPDNNISFINFLLDIKDDVEEKAEAVAVDETTEKKAEDVKTEPKKPEQFNRPVKFEIKHNKKK